MFLIVENWQCWNSNLDSSLGNGDCLLFHSLMDSHLILGVHFVKFVYTTHSIVRQHKGTCFNHKLVRFFILNHSSCQTCSRTGLSTGVHSSWTELFNLEKFIETMCTSSSKEFYQNGGIIEYWMKRCFICVYLLLTCFRNWLLAVLGSPTTQMLMSPRRLVFSRVIFGTPPNNMRRIPRLTSSLPTRW